MYCEPTQPGFVWEKCDQTYTAILGILPYIVFYTNRTVYYKYYIYETLPAEILKLSKHIHGSNVI